jgi:hypothetical protein
VPAASWQDDICCVEIPVSVMVNPLSATMRTVDQSAATAVGLADAARMGCWQVVAGHGNKFVSVQAA